MVKWKKMNKKMAGLLLGVMMLFTASTTAFAYVDESAEASKVETTQTDQSTDKEEKKDEAASTNEVLPEDGTDQGTAFTTVTSRHRGAKPLRRYELLGGISLLSPEYLLSFERCPFHTETPDHYALVSYLIDL